MDDNDEQHVYFFVREEKYYCGPITKCYGVFLCIFFFPGLIFLPFCLCDKKEYGELRNKNSFNK